MTAPIGLLAVATAAPPHQLPQDQVTEAARAHFQARFPQFERLMPVFENAGILRRQSVMPMDWYLQPRGWPERSEAYLAGGVALFAEAAEQALAAAGLMGADIDVIVTVSSTGIATPSLEARCMDRLGFRTDAARVPVFGLGCAAAPPAWRSPPAWPRPSPDAGCCWWSLSSARSPSA